MSFIFAFTNNCENKWTKYKIQLKLLLHNLQNAKLNGFTCCDFEMLNLLVANILGFTALWFTVLWFQTCGFPVF
jgi:hypothetical protein